MKKPKKTSIDNLMDWIIWGDKKEYYNPQPYKSDANTK